LRGSKGSSSTPTSVYTRQETIEGDDLLLSRDKQSAHHQPNIPEPDYDDTSEDDDRQNKAAKDLSTFKSGQHSSSHSQSQVTNQSSSPLNVSSNTANGSNQRMTQSYAGTSNSTSTSSAQAKKQGQVMMPSGKSNIISS